jgi:hypothetical protein
MAAGPAVRPGRPALDDRDLGHRHRGRRHGAAGGLAFLYGAFSLPLYPLALAHTFDQVRAGEFVETSSGLLLIYAIGAVVGPVPASLLMVQLGTPTLFAFVGAVNVVLVAFTLYRMGQRARAPAESRPGFVSVQPATQGAIGLDPRAPETPAVETAER